MKKYLIILAIVFVGVFTVGCFSDIDKLCWDNVSEYRSNLFVLSNDKYFASFVAGKREQDFSYDGKSSKLVEYGVITVRFNGGYAGTLPSFVMFIDSLEYSGHLEFNPIDSTYVADINKEISSKADISLQVLATDINEQGNMTCISNGFKIDYKKAFSIAIEKLKSTINKYNENGKLNGEFFIKIVGEESSGNIYWYIVFVTKGGKSFALIIDVNTGKIAAQK